MVRAFHRPSAPTAMRPQQLRCPRPQRSELIVTHLTVVHRARSWSGRPRLIEAHPVGLYQVRKACLCSANRARVARHRDAGEVLKKKRWTIVKRRPRAATCTMAGVARQNKGKLKRRVGSDLSMQQPFFLKLKASEEGQPRDNARVGLTQHLLQSARGLAKFGGSLDLPVDAHRGRGFGHHQPLAAPLCISLPPAAVQLLRRAVACSVADHSGLRREVVLFWHLSPSCLVPASRLLRA